MAESGGGVALINEGKYGVGAKNSRMSLSLLRATIRPDPTSDMGEHDFCYVIYPHEGSFLDAEINRKATEYNIPLLFADDFSLPFTVPEHLMLQAVKKAEDSDAVIVRLCEQDGKRGQFTLPKPVKTMNLLEEVQQETDTISYHPFEILTFAIS